MAATKKATPMNTPRPGGQSPEYGGGKAPPMKAPPMNTPRPGGGGSTPGMNQPKPGGGSAPPAKRPPGMSPDMNYISSKPAAKPAVGMVRKTGMK